MRRAAKGLVVAVALGSACYGFARLQNRVPARPTSGVASAAPPVVPPSSLVDPLVRGRATRRVGTSTEADASAEDHGDWVHARPAFQSSRSSAERGGIEPCATQPVDASAFADWVPLAQGRFSAPRELSLDQSGGLDLVIHLLGDEPIRRELIESGAEFVLYTLTVGVNTSYAPLFSGTHLYESIIAGVAQSLSAREGKPVHVRHVVLSAWSAGFVGIEAALGQRASKDVDAVVLVDGLHAPRNDRSAFEAQLKPFVDYAARAAAGERFMFVSHSSIDPPGFASTTECAHYLIASLGGEPLAVRREDALGLELVEYFTRGDFHVRGYAGNDKPDHCAQLGVLRDVYAALGRRFSRESAAKSR